MNNRVIIMSCSSTLNPPTGTVQAFLGKNAPYQIKTSGLKKYNSTCKENENVCSELLDTSLKNACNNLLRISILPYNKNATTCAGNIDNKDPSKDFNSYLSAYIDKIMKLPNKNDVEKKQIIEKTMSNILCQSQQSFLEYKTDKPGHGPNNKYSPTRFVYDKVNNLGPVSRDINYWISIFIIGILILCSIYYLSLYLVSVKWSGWDFIFNISLIIIFSINIIIAYNSHISTINTVQNSDKYQTFYISIIPIALSLPIIYYSFMADDIKIGSYLFYNILYLIIANMMSVGNYINPQSVNQSFFGIIILLFIAKTIENKFNNFNNLTTKSLSIIFSLIPFILITSGFFDITDEKGQIGGPLGISFGYTIIIYIIWLFVYIFKTDIFTKCDYIPNLNIFEIASKFRNIYKSQHISKVVAAQT